MTYDPDLSLAIQEMAVMLLIKPLALMMALDLVSTLAITFMFPFTRRLSSK
jgi:hypothetical protein